VGFAPYRPYPFFRRLAPWPFLWLGCWTANITATLDTLKSVHQLGCLNKGTVVLSVFRAGRVYVTRTNPLGVD
jgi:hypothetical protein